MSTRSEKNPQTLAFLTNLLNSVCRPGKTSNGTSTILAVTAKAEPSPSCGSSGTLSEVSQSSGLIRANARSGNGSGREGDEGGPCGSLTESGTLPSNIKTSGSTRCTSSPTSTPLGKTIRANTVPLAKNVVPGLIFMSRIVTFRRICGLGWGAGKSVSTERPGMIGEEMMMSLDWAER